MGGQPSVLDKPEASFIKAAVAENCVVVFSKTSCPYCHSTKKLFQDLGVQPQVYELNQRSDGEAIQDVLSEMTGARTVPRVFVNGQCIGGNSDTQSLHKSGKLLQLIQQCSN